LDSDVLMVGIMNRLKINHGKVGEPYNYPDSFMQLLGYLRIYFYLPYRQSEGVVIAQSTKVPGIPDFSTISRRINRLEIRINERLGNDIVIALDSTGIEVSNHGEWMRNKWHVRKGYLHIYVVVDINRKRILSLEVTSEEVHDGRMLNKLVNNASSFAAGGNHVKGVLADGITIATRISDMYEGTY